MNLFKEAIKKDRYNRARRLAFEPNPVIRAYGFGPENTCCKTCSHLIKRVYSGTYYKCGLRQNTGGPATDHRINWNACGRYEDDTL